MPDKRQILELIARSQGIIQLAPTFVPRFYRDFDRLEQHKRQDKLRTAAAANIPERWIASSVEAINPPPLPPGGVSMLADLPRLSLGDTIRGAPRETIGDELLAHHGPEFRVLVKVLDPGEPIPFHLHANDAQVRRLTRPFRDHRFGKDEAYYFLDAPKGPLPYTHAGVYPGVTRRALLDAIKKGRDHALELSPVMYQEYERGFILPAGVPHSPGTALTLEIQQPSDVYTLLETRAAGKQMSPTQIHPGFKSLEEAFQLVDMRLARRVGQLDEFRLWPDVISSGRGGEIAWIFPPDICKKFCGKRIRLKSRLTICEAMPIAMLIWKGRGRANGRSVCAGDEFFITAETMRAGVELESHDESTLEAFTFWPVVDSSR